MVLEVWPLAIPEVREIRPGRHRDERGFFSETWSRRDWVRAGIDLDFVQDNHSLSLNPCTVRGLHYQLEPTSQDKLIRVVSGAIFDVAVDIRRSSPTFGKWVGLEISAEAWNQLLVPKGFAHGFMTLLPDTEVMYKVTAPYSAVDERAIRFDDPAIGIEWPKPAEELTLTKRDREAPLLQSADLFE